MRGLALGACALAACGLADAGLARPPVFDAGPTAGADGGALSHLGGDGGTDGRCGPCGRACDGAETCVDDACVPRAGAPRLLAPVSLGRLTSQRPTLRWLSPAGVGEARVQVCRDRACGDVVQSADATGRSLRLPAALAPGVYFWRVFAKRDGAVAAEPSATWEFRVRAHDAAVDTNIGGLVDFDGDGYGDLVVGTSMPQRVGLYMGGPGGVPTAPTGAVPQNADGTSESVSTAGDLNGDGYGDLLSFEQAGGARRVVLHPGGPRGAAAPAVTLTASDPWPDTLGSAGDVDGDGYGDLVGVDAGGGGPPGQVRVFFGGPAGVRPLSAVMIPGDADTASGLVSTGGGDLNGDGRPDFLFGMPSGADGAGRAVAWVNGGCGVGRVVALPGDATAFAHFGDALSLGGDFDGDGYADAVVAAPHDASAVDQSALWIFPGGADGPVTASPRRIPFAGRQTENIRLIGSGDLNGDGYADLGAWMHTDLRPTEMLLFYGSATGLPAAPARALGHGDYGPDETGFGVGFAGDPDRDGFDDLTVFLSPGRVVISRGSPDGPIAGNLPGLVLP